MKETNMEATLLVLAAGMGSRYGGLKQMDAFGPHGETIIDYSIYDAIDAGFEKVVFVVRNSFKDEFQKYFKERIGDRIKMEFVAQEIENVPSGCTYTPDREKPWGTAHAVLVCKDVIDQPFAVINADDYYGKESFGTLIDFFNSQSDNSAFSVVSYLLDNTLSDHGSVNRGVCHSDENGNLTKIIETLKIKRNEDGSISYPMDTEGEGRLAPDTLVSMNMFGFFPNFFELTESYFKQFIDELGMELKSEFFIPSVLDKMINAQQISVKVLQSPSKWFGVTYKEDKPIVMDKINALIADGAYPEKLWG